jgi:hypothetical protein
MRLPEAVGSSLGSSSHILLSGPSILHPKSIKNQAKAAQIHQKPSKCSKTT